MAEAFEIQADKLIKAINKETKSFELFDIESLWAGLDLGEVILEKADKWIKFSIEKGIESAADVTGIQLIMKDTPRIVNAQADILKKIKSLTDRTSIENMRTLITDSFREKDTVQQLTRKIREEFSQYSKVRAEMIARTESANAYGNASLEYYKEAGLHMKAWYTMNDDLVAPECQANEAQGAIPINDNFSSGVQNEPNHVNCRCSVVPVADSDVNTGQKPMPETPIEQNPEPQQVAYSNSTKIEDAEKWAKDNLGIEDVDYRKVDVTVADKVNNSLSELTKRYQNTLTKIEEYKDGDLAYAAIYNDSSLQLSANYFKDNTNLAKSYAGDVKSHFHFATQAGKEIESVVTHEFAHTISYGKVYNITGEEFAKVSQFNKEISKIKGAYNKDMRKLINGATAEQLKDGGVYNVIKDIFISDYANKGVALGEFLAEAFSQYYTGATVSPYSTKVVNLVKEYFGK